MFFVFIDAKINDFRHTYEGMGKIVPKKAMFLRAEDINHYLIYTNKSSGCTNISFICKNQACICSMRRAASTIARTYRTIRNLVAAPSLPSSSVAST